MNQPRLLPPPMRLTSWLAALLIAAATTSCRHPPLPTVATVDLDRYAGTWHEIARLPNRFQKRCDGNVQANYRLDGKIVRVHNQCRQANGQLAEVNGIAKVVPNSGNAKLRVSFFRPFYGNYWILALDPDYQWALVGEPSRKYAWILARQTTLDPSTIEQLLTQADALGFDRQAFLPTRQP